jgi:hypothetical protein
MRLKDQSRERIERGRIETGSGEMTEFPIANIDDVDWEKNDPIAVEYPDGHRALLRPWSYREACGQRARELETEMVKRNPFIRAIVEKRNRGAAK